ncbi:hypothetical protein ANCCAN_19129 [Ancylostoma caninum]|uniref:Uncharacterized protein n=1 Tax=Ancylostoma caninum TaxID=29170 RepID=A0A368FS34_ANCCA|nr:hypothetical protein ANCCAN_19129 [Ancylostoma caninum]
MLAGPVVCIPAYAVSDVTCSNSYPQVIRKLVVFLVRLEMILRSVDSSPQIDSGFVVKKPKPKDVLAPEHQRNRYEDNEPTPPIRHHPDAYGRLASWIQQNARSYLPIRHPQTTLDVHVSAGLYQIVDLVREFMPKQRSCQVVTRAYFPAKR